MDGKSKFIVAPTIKFSNSQIVFKTVARLETLFQHEFREAKEWLDEHDDSWQERLRGAYVDTGGNKSVAATQMAQAVLYRITSKRLQQKDTAYGERVLKLVQQKHQQQTSVQQVFKGMQDSRNIAPTKQV
jgi:hypothetical protein